MRLLFILVSVILSATATHAAMVVTRSERLSGTIVSNDDLGVTLKLDEGGTKMIPRTQILQLFDDEGEILWQAELPKVEYPPVTAAKESRPASSRRTVFGNFMIGGVASGYYREENRLIDAMSITATYSDGAQQTAQASILSMGGGVDYQWYTNSRISSLVSYFYRSATQTVFTGDGRNYQKITLAEERVTAIHTLMYGREMHFYPANDEVSLDIIAQAGYQIGSYNALATYRSLYGMLTPRPVLYTGASDILFHGPTARVGAGISFHGTGWIFRLNGYYQAAAAFNSDKVDFTSGTTSIASTNAVNLLQDFYASAAIGLSF